MQDIGTAIPAFLNMIQSTKNLSDKTISAYHSDLRDYMKSVSNSESKKT